MTDSKFFFRNSFIIIFPCVLFAVLKKSADFFKTQGTCPHKDRSTQTALPVPPCSRKDGNGDEERQYQQKSRNRQCERQQFERRKQPLGTERTHDLLQGGERIAPQSLFRRIRIFCGANPIFASVRRSLEESACAGKEEETEKSGKHKQPPSSADSGGCEFCKLFERFAFIHLFS